MRWFRSLVERVRRIEGFVAVKQRSDTMKFIPAAPGDDINYCSRRLSELGLITGRQNLKLRNCLLVELCGRPAVDGVLVRLSIDEKIVIAAALAQHRVGVVSRGLPVDGDSRHELQEVQVVTPVDGQVLDLLRSDGRARGRRIRLQQWQRI